MNYYNEPCENTCYGCRNLAKRLQEAEQENAELKAQNQLLREELSDAFFSNRCGCGHPACNRCERDEEYEKALNSATAQPLNELNVQAIEDMLDCCRCWTDQCGDDVIPLDDIQDYVNKIRGE